MEVLLEVVKEDFMASHQFLISRCSWYRRENIFAFGTLIGSISPKGRELIRKAEAYKWSCDPQFLCYFWTKFSTLPGSAAQFLLLQLGRVHHQALGSTHLGFRSTALSIKQHKTTRNITSNKSVKLITEDWPNMKRPYILDYTDLLVEVHEV